MASKLMLMLASLALLVMFTDSQTVTVEPPTNSSTDPPSTEPTTESPLIAIQDNLCADVDLAIDTQCLSEVDSQTYTITFSEKSRRKCRKLVTFLTAKSATVTISICKRRSSRIQVVLTIDQLQSLCKHRFAKNGLFNCIREPEPGEEDLCTIGQGSCPGNTDRLALCQQLNVACVPPGIPGFCYCPGPDEICF